MQGENDMFGHIFGSVEKIKQENKAHILVLTSSRIVLVVYIINMLCGNIKEKKEVLIMSEERKDSKAYSMFQAKLVEKNIFNIYKEDVLVAEVRGTNPETQQVIPMRELNNYEENKLHEYIGHLGERND